MRLVTAIATLLPILALARSSAHAEADPDLSRPAESGCPAAEGHAARYLGDASLASINAVRGFDFAELVLEASPTPFIIIEGAPAAIINIAVASDDGAVSFARRGCVESRTPIRITVAAPSFEEISASSSTRVFTRGVIRSAGDATIELDEARGSRIDIIAAGEVVVFASGPGRHELSVVAASVVAMHTGTGDITLSGSVVTASLGQRGLGAVFARSLEAIEEIIVETDGGSVFAVK